MLVSPPSIADHSESEAVTPGRLRLVVMRHGATDLTGKVLNGGGGSAADPDLNDVGQSQVARSGELLTRVGRPPAALTSPARRARSTAQGLGYEAVVDERLREVDLGDWEGRVVADLHREDAGGVGRWLADPEAAPPGGEPLLAVAERLAALVRDLQTSGTEDLLLVGHATTVALLVGAALGSPIEHARRVATPPGVVAGLSFWSDGGSALELLAAPATV